MKTCAIVIPTFNEGERVYKTINKLVADLQTFGLPFLFEIVVVDDASYEAVDIENKVEKNFPIFLLRHPINLGQGGALETGFAFCRNILKPSFVITMDGDGQHDNLDIPRFLNYINNNDLDIVFASRFEKSAYIPFTRKLILKLASRFEVFITGLNLSDAHNGFRIFNSKCLEKMRLTQNRMAHATEIKQIVSCKKLKYSELQNNITYSEDSLRKGQSNSGALLILRDLINSYLFDG